MAGRSKLNKNEIMTQIFESNAREAKLSKMLAIIRRNPGIRASEINRALKLEFSWNLRLALLERELVRVEDDGSAIRYFPVLTSP